MKVRIISDAAGLAGLHEDWLRLWDSHLRREVFTHPAWAEVFVKSCGCGRGLHCLVAEEKNAVIAILPLFRDVKGCLRFVGDPRSDYSDMLCDPVHAEQAAEVFLAAMKSERQVCLSAVPEHGLLLQALNRRGGHRFMIEVEEPCPAIVFDAAGEIAKSLLKKESLRRHEKKVAKLGPVRMVRITDRDEAMKRLPDFFDQHRARWRTTGTPSLFESAENRAFYDGIVADDELWPMTDFRLLFAGERLAAAHFGFFHHRRFIWYKPSFDPELSSLGPGEVLLKHLIEAAACEGAVEFDFTRGGEAFKQRFATVIRSNFVIRRRTLAQRLRAAASRAKSRLLKKQPT